MFINFFEIIAKSKNDEINGTDHCSFWACQHEECPLFSPTAP